MRATWEKAFALIVAIAKAAVSSLGNFGGLAGEGYRKSLVQVP